MEANVAKNDKIIILEEGIYGLILNDGKLLVVEDGHVTSLGNVPEDKYFVPPFDVLQLPWETQLIFNGVMISQGMDSPFLTAVSGFSSGSGALRDC